MNVSSSPPATEMSLLSQRSMKIIDAFVKIHDAHVLHGDFELRHVLSRPNDAQVYIVDFECASDGHVCKRDQASLRKYEWKPSKGIFGCDELFDAACDLRIWTPCRPLVLAVVTAMMTFFSAIGVVRFNGNPVYIWTNPTSDSYIRWCKAHEFQPDLDKLRKEADSVLEDFYNRYQDRFPLIGDPRQGGPPP